MSSSSLTVTVQLPAQSAAWQIAFLLSWLAVPDPAEKSKRRKTMLQIASYLVTDLAEREELGIDYQIDTRTRQGGLLHLEGVLRRATVSGKTLLDLMFKVEDGLFVLRTKSISVMRKQLGVGDLPGAIFTRNWTAMLPVVHLSAALAHLQMTLGAKDPTKIVDLLQDPSHLQTLLHRAAAINAALPVLAPFSSKRPMVVTISG